MEVFIRGFNLLFAVFLLIHLLHRIKRVRVYRRVAVFILLSLLYSIISYVNYFFLHNPLLPSFTAFGAAIYLAAIAAVINSWVADDNRL